MDIGYSEWDVLKQLLNSDKILKSIKQILIEFHFIGIETESEHVYSNQQRELEILNGLLEFGYELFYISQNQFDSNCYEIGLKLRSG